MDPDSLYSLFLFEALGKGADLVCLLFGELGSKIGAEFAHWAYMPSAEPTSSWYILGTLVELIMLNPRCRLNFCVKLAWSLE